MTGFPTTLNGIWREISSNLVIKLSKRKNLVEKKAAGIATNIEVLILQCCERSLPYAGKE